MEYSIILYPDLGRLHMMIGLEFNIWKRYYIDGHWPPNPMFVLALGPFHIYGQWISKNFNKESNANNIS